MAPSGGSRGSKGKCVFTQVEDAIRELRANRAPDQLVEEAAGDVALVKYLGVQAADVRGDPARWKDFLNRNLRPGVCLVADCYDDHGEHQGEQGLLVEEALSFSQDGGQFFQAKFLGCSDHT